MVETTGGVRKGLEFAPGTTDHCKRLVGRMFAPAVLLDAYRTAREVANTGDIVLVASDQSPDIGGGSRMEYAKHLQKVFGSKASAFGMWKKSAHSVVRLPPDSEAMWLVVDVKGADLPIMCVIYVTPYAIASAAN